MKTKTLILILILLFLIYLCFINISSCIYKCNYEKFQISSNSNTDYNPVDYLINNRKYREITINFLPPDTDNKVDCYLLILYYHGYTNDFGTTNSHMNSVFNYCIQNYNEKKIVIASLLGKEYNGYTSWNITDYSDSNNLNENNIGTGYGFNSASITTCSYPSAESMRGDNNNNDLRTDCNYSLPTNGCRWTSCSDDLSFTKDVIDKYNASKICAFGFSAGAVFTYILPNYIEEIKTIVTFAGNIPFGLVVPKVGTNILDFHGTNDPWIPGITSSESNASVSPESCSLSANLKKSMKQYLKHNYKIKKIDGHYTCDADTEHRYLYHRTDDLLKKISGISETDEYQKYDDIRKDTNLQNILQNSLQGLETHNNIQNIFKYSDSVYSIEWEGDHNFPIINNGNSPDSTGFHMAIDYFMHDFKNANNK